MFGGYQADVVLPVKTFTIWTKSYTIKAIELMLSDDWTRIQEGFEEPENKGAHVVRDIRVYLCIYVYMSVCRCMLCGFVTLRHVIADIG